MLLDDVQQTMGVAGESLRIARGQPKPADAVSALYLDTLGISEEEKTQLAALARAGTSAIDPVVAFMVGATSGYMYKHVIGTLDAYPIPELRLPDGGGKRLLDIGCNWGRWSIAAARKGYDVAGIDPQLGAVMAARRVCRSLGLNAHFVVGDGRHLPFAAETFDYAFSYSVLQHLSRSDVQRVLAGVSRALKRGGVVLVQMPTVFGIRCLYHLARRGFRDGDGFEVRYWTIPALEALFEKEIGPATTSVDCYFGIGLQRSDWNLMPPSRKAILAASEWLRAASRAVPPLKYVADSVYVESTKSVT